ncbi:hypothetical protein [Vibrio phage RYC]|nr:hypothetical protein [Vibrio phage RYC]
MVWYEILPFILGIVYIIGAFVCPTIWKHFNSELTFDFESTLISSAFWPVVMPLWLAVVGTQALLDKFFKKD